METSTPDRQVRTLLTLAVVQFGVICGLAAGILFKIDGSTLPAATVSGCTAFASGVVLAITLFHFWNKGA
ncbi:hypothetical protein [Actinomadura hibisca]|uniref:hypothetical protein n=1 Tax=Actinomadura hibisca TaxID=68565 RepID=UPI0008377CA1|nr:hypothetical protein [Actinomadura hibisca]